MPRGLLHEPFLEQGRPHGRTRVAGDRARHGRSPTASWTAAPTAWAHRAAACRARAPTELVAVVMEKGWEQVVAVLGILDAGAAYLPIDAGLPGERIAQILGARRGRDRACSPSRGAAGAPGLARRARRRCVAGRARAPAHGAAALQPLQQPDDLAYVIFTSGSTGTPKGVMIDHRGALNTVLDINRRFGVGAGRPRARRSRR